MADISPTYYCVASGKTFPIKEELKKRGFVFMSATKTWSRAGVLESERRDWEDEVSDGSWHGVVLEFDKEEEVPF